MILNHSLSKIFRNLLITIVVFLAGINNIHASEPLIRIHYLGHSAFVLQFDNGISIVTDYGYENAWVKWGWDSPIRSIGDFVPNVITYSHQHDDHYDSDRIPKGVKYILTSLDSLTIDGIKITPIRTCEDSIHIESNTSFIFDYKGIKICHMGDAQAQIMNIYNEEVKNYVIKIFPDTFDLLLMPIEGKQKFIPEAEAFINLLHPKKVIPMHYWSQAYKDDFFNYLKVQNDSDDKYLIQVTDSPFYELSTSDKIDLINVIGLVRKPFKCDME